MRIQPTVARSMPLTLAVTAKARIARGLSQTSLQMYGQAVAQLADR